MITDLPDEAFTEPWQARLFAMAQVACRNMDQPWDAFVTGSRPRSLRSPTGPTTTSWMVALEQLTVYS